MDFSALSDEKIIELIEKNNEIMQNMINLDPSIVESRDKKELDGIFLENVEYYKEGFQRRLKLPNSSFMMAIATILGYSPEELKIGKRNKLTKK